MILLTYANKHSMVSTTFYPFKVKLTEVLFLAVWSPTNQDDTTISVKDLVIVLVKKFLFLPYSTLFGFKFNLCILLI